MVSKTKEDIYILYILIVFSSTILYKTTTFNLLCSNNMENQLDIILHTLLYHLNWYGSVQSKTVQACDQNAPYAIYKSFQYL